MINRKLMILQALIQMKNSIHAIDKANFRSTYAILFFGVPNQGMNISSLIPMAGEYNLPLVMDLRKESELLRELHREFILHFDYRTCKVISYYETKVSPSAVKVSCSKQKLLTYYQALLM